MDLIDTASIALQVLIRAGAGLRIAYCFLRLGLCDEEALMYKKRIRNAIIFLVIAELVWVIKTLIIAYFG